MPSWSDQGLRARPLPAWGAVVADKGPTGRLVVDDAGAAVEPVQRFLVEFVARGNRPGSVRSYAYDLLRWWRVAAGGRRRGA